MGSAERGTSVRATTRITATIIVALCAMTVHADAYAVTAYAAGGVATYDSGGLILAYGVRCNSRMYPKQSPQDHDWVNSLYARQDDGDFLEAGWYWTPTSTNRIWFSVLQQRGYIRPLPGRSHPEFPTLCHSGVEETTCAPAPDGPAGAPIKYG